MLKYLKLCIVPVAVFLVGTPQLISAMTEDQFNSMQRLTDQYRGQPSQAEGKDIIFFIGNTTAGKSTLINTLVDPDSLLFDGQKIVLKPEYKSKDDHSHVGIGEEKNKSTTRYPKIIEKTINNHTFYFCDLPGFRDTRSQEDELLNAAFIKHVISRAKTVRFVFVVSAASFDAGEVLTTLLDDTSKMFGENYKRLKELSSLLVVTKNTDSEYDDDCYKFIDTESGQEQKQVLSSWKNGRAFITQNPKDFGKKIDPIVPQKILAVLKDLPAQPQLTNINADHILKDKTKNALSGMFEKFMSESLKTYNYEGIETLEEYQDLIQQIYRDKNKFWTLFREKIEAINTVNILKSIADDIYSTAFEKFKNDHQAFYEETRQKLITQRNKLISEWEKTCQKIMESSLENCVKKIKERLKLKTPLRDLSSADLIDYKASLDSFDSAECNIPDCKLRLQEESYSFGVEEEYLFSKWQNDFLNKDQKTKIDDLKKEIASRKTEAKDRQNNEKEMEKLKQETEAAQTKANDEEKARKKLQDEKDEANKKARTRCGIDPVASGIGTGDSPAEILASMAAKVQATKEDWYKTAAYQYGVRVECNVPMDTIRISFAQAASLGCKKAKFNLGMLNNGSKNHKELEQTSRNYFIAAGITKEELDVLVKFNAIKHFRPENLTKIIIDGESIHRWGVKDRHWIKDDTMGWIDPSNNDRTSIFAAIIKMFSKMDLLETINIQDYLTDTEYPSVLSFLNDTCPPKVTLEFAQNEISESNKKSLQEAAAKRGIVLEI